MRDVPFRVFASTQRDAYRKPIPGMWWELETLYKRAGKDIGAFLPAFCPSSGCLSSSYWGDAIADKASSMYVGDAAGRKDDHSDSDRKFALNAGLSFFTPEEFFSGKAKEAFTLKGFHPSSLSSSRACLLRTVLHLPSVR